MAQQMRRNNHHQTALYRSSIDDAAATENDDDNDDDANDADVDRRRDAPFTGGIGRRSGAVAAAAPLQQMAFAAWDDAAADPDAEQLTALDEFVRDIEYGL